MSSTAELEPALRTAWGVNRHSVIEVVTDRGSNLDRHRQVQAAVQAVVGRVLDLLAPLGPAAAPAPGGATELPALLAGPSSAALAAAGWELQLQSATYQRYSLPLAKPLTTAAAAGSGSDGSSLGRREGLLLRLSLGVPGSEEVAVGLGDVAPLPGLHRESLQAAEQQLALLCELLSGGQLRVPLTVALLGGRFSRWLEESAGLSLSALHPSVRCGLEVAVLSALAALRGVPLSQLLATAAGSAASEALAAAAADGAARGGATAINGLLDCQGSPEQAAADAAALVRQHGFTCLKLKVGRRADPTEDAAAVHAVRAVVGPRVTLCADANRRWRLDQALAFGAAAAGAGLEYVEEPVAGGSSWEVEEFHRQTGIPVALDETVDQGEAGWLGGNGWVGGRGSVRGWGEGMENGLLLQDRDLWLLPGDLLCLCLGRSACAHGCHEQLTTMDLAHELCFKCRGGGPWGQLRALWRAGRGSAGAQALRAGRGGADHAAGRVGEAAGHASCDQLCL